MAERYGDELAGPCASPRGRRGEPGFGVPVTLGTKAGGAAVPELRSPQPAPAPATAPWAYVKIAEGCDRNCGFCAIPTFRGPQRSRTPESILAEVDELGAQEIVLVAQDLAVVRQGRHWPGRGLASCRWSRRSPQRSPWVRLLYLYPV